MKKLYVYADFDWLKEIELIGELGYESLRGSDSIRGCNTHSRGKIFSGVFPMRCQTVGDVPYFYVGSR